MHNRKYQLLPLAIASLLLSACGTIPKGTISKMIAEQNFTPFIPPQGNPQSQTSWNLRGPGAIVRTQRYEVEYEAQHVIGKDGLARVAADANNPTTRVPFAAFSNKVTKGNEFDFKGGWSIDGAQTIKAALHLDNATSVDIKFGDSWIAELSEQALRDAPGRSQISRPTVANLRGNALGRPKSHLVLKTVYTDSLKIYFNVRREGGGEIAYKVPTIDEQKLGGKFRVTSDGGVEVSGPIMVGYVAVSRDGIAQIFPKN